MTAAILCFSSNSSAARLDCRDKTVAVNGSNGVIAAGPVKLFIICIIRGDCSGKLLLLSCLEGDV